jgi:hypothetical protein
MKTLHTLGERYKISTQFGLPTGFLIGRVIFSNFTIIAPAIALSSLTGGSKFEVNDPMLCP